MSVRGRGWTDAMEPAPKDSQRLGNIAMLRAGRSRAKALKKAERKVEDAAKDVGKLGFNASEENLELLYTAARKGNLLVIWRLDAAAANDQISEVAGESITARGDSPIVRILRKLYRDHGKAFFYLSDESEGEGTTRARAWTG
ncbi:hypothetical protein FRB95_007478 [Tulasnella sp. JGI-2019a]|nr:hypothetical protein FRB95_007478 [Tulasnella sp. JGI-2019a]